MIWALRPYRPCLPPADIGSAKGGQVGHILLKDGSGVRKRAALSQGRRRDGAEVGSRKFSVENYA